MSLIAAVHSHGSSSVSHRCHCLSCRSIVSHTTPAKKKPSSRASIRQWPSNSSNNMCRARETQSPNAPIITFSSSCLRSHSLLRRVDATSSASCLYRESLQLSALTFYKSLLCFLKSISDSFSLRQHDDVAG